ncbi:MAG: hypothetical protein N3A65_04780 [candidate division WOR-3 bacterium]|nr:hypothetical protein [candidate division WOR-3 bacterium]
MKMGILMLIASLTVLFAKKPEEVVENYLDKLKIGTPVEYKNLKIYPLEISVAGEMKDFTTLDEAMDKGWLKIKEIGSGNVNQVEIKNNGDEPVFILTGEMIVGAKQDRMLKSDVLLPPNSGWIKVEVYCVEHGRWIEVSKEFKSSRLLVPNTVRQRAKLSESQTEVWAEVSRTQNELGIVSGTGTVRANYENEKVQKVVDDYTRKFRNIPKLSKSTIGVVVTSGDRIICLDLFASNSLLNKLWTKLVKSYAMDAIGSTRSSVTKEQVAEFLALIDGAKLVSVGTPGLGDLLSINADAGKGSVLVYEETVVHLDFFPDEDNFKEKDSGLRLDFRRDQRIER